MEKEKLTDNLKNEIETTRVEIAEELDKQIKIEEKLFPEFRKSAGTHREVLGQQLENVNKRIRDLRNMQKSPFFAKLIYFAKDESVYKYVYISKYSFTELNISSWVAPVAALRFEDLGPATFKFPDGTKKDVDLNEKESYVIAEEKLIYFSKENKQDGVTIVYEDFFSNAKTEFGLSEIISKIQKEQYQIIQSDPFKHLIISGPAGSGKTTICLHRVAYLMQSPETENRYAGHRMIMFVQDISSKEYFSSLLPKLGIENMDILTYFEWSIKLLNLPKITEKNTYNMNEGYLEYLEFKTNLFHKIKGLKFTRGNFISQLEKIYAANMPEKYYLIFVNNSKKLIFDYVDVSIMLIMLQEKGGLYRNEKFNKLLDNEEIKTINRKIKVEYSMMIVDEFQNYTQEQLSVIKMCLNKDTNSLTFIGDINQRNAFKPISSSNNANYFDDCNKIHLSKVFRNTKQILQFIQNLGYDISVPKEAREGEIVTEILSENLNDFSLKLNQLLMSLDIKNNQNTVGILCDNQELKSIITDLLQKNNYGSNLRILTKQESQGTEFNTAIVVNGDFEEGKIESKLFADMKKNAQKNNDYVGYTRAVEKLIVIKI